MNKKLLALSFFVGLVGLIEACFCRDALPYYDYHKLQIFYGTSVIGTDTSQSFYITLDSLDNLASTYVLQTLLEFPFYPGQLTLIYTSYLPSDTSQVFEITMRITKSNGSVAEGKLGGVKFQ